MARKQTLLNATWSDRFKESYAALPAEKQRACDGAAMALIKREAPSGLRVKPIRPDNWYHEARVNSGDRIVFRAEGDTIHFIDVVSHDDIGRYSRKPKANR